MLLLKPPAGREAKKLRFADFINKNLCFGSLWLEETQKSSDLLILSIKSVAFEAPGWRRLKNAQIYWFSQLKVLLLKPPAGGDSEKLRFADFLNK